jgi:2-polyprenyl-6-hydroxyphenyl methylase / 3-demethylubiquinone-9 3-methyltransferase
VAFLKTITLMNKPHVTPQFNNVDLTEIEKFSDLAHGWWDLEGEFRPLHQINPLRLDWINQISSIKNKRVLDVGCGGGILTEAMAKADASQAMGIDLAPKSLKIARLHALENGVGNAHYKDISVEQLAQEQAGSFDMVTCLEMLEHVPDPAAIVQACADLAKPGAWVFFSTLNRNARSFIQAIIGAEYVLGLVPRGTHQYAKFIRPSELAAWCRNSGLTLKHSTGLDYNPLTQAYRLGPNTTVNYLMATQKLA